MMIFCMATCFLSFEGFAALPTDFEAMVESGKLKVAMQSDDQMPFFFQSPNGILMGIDVELAKRMSDFLGLELVIKRDYLTGDEVIRAVQKGEADLGISRLSSNLSWALKVNFSKPYLVLRQVLLINRLRKASRPDRRPFSGPLKSGGAKTMGVLKDSAYQTFAQQFFSEYVQVPFSNQEEMLNEVEKGSLYAALTDGVTAQSWMVKNPAKAIRVEVQHFKDRDDPIAFALPWQRQHFLRWVDLFVAELDKSKELDRMLEPYQQWMHQQ